MFGEMLWDILPSGEVVGGAPFNQAFRCHELGAEVNFVTRLGEDVLGRMAHQFLLERGISDRWVQWDPVHPTGTVPVHLDASGSPTFNILPDVAYDYIEGSREMLDAAATCDALVYGTLIQRAPESRRTLAGILSKTPASVLRFCDLNLRKDCYFEETIEASLEAANILKLNLEEAHYLAELFEISVSSLPGFCQELMTEWKLAVCVVTLGAHGALAVGRGGEVAYVPGYGVQVADTCGSGDAFAAGFLHRYLGGAGLDECCLTGVALGAISATRVGATGAISRADLESFLKSPPPRLVEPGLKAHLDQKGG